MEGDDGDRAAQPGVPLLEIDADNLVAVEDGGSCVTVSRRDLMELAARVYASNICGVCMDDAAECAVLYCGHPLCLTCLRRLAGGHHSTARQRLDGAGSAYCQVYPSTGARLTCPSCRQAVAVGVVYRLGLDLATAQALQLLRGPLLEADSNLTALLNRVLPSHAGSCVYLDFDYAIRRGVWQHPQTTRVSLSAKTRTPARQSASSPAGAAPAAPPPPVEEPLPAADNWMTDLVEEEPGPVPAPPRTVQPQAAPPSAAAGHQEHRLGGWVNEFLRFSVPHWGPMD